jgi:hypothetical protein
LKATALLVMLGLELAWSMLLAMGSPFYFHKSGAASFCITVDGRNQWELERSATYSAQTENCDR